MNIIEKNTKTQLSKALFWNGEFLASLFEINRLIHNRVKESQSIVASQVRKFWLLVLYRLTVVYSNFGSNCSIVLGISVHSECTFFDAKY